MKYTVRELITTAYDLAMISIKSFQCIDGMELIEGLKTLNFLLSKKSMEHQKIPYFTEYSLNAIGGQEDYFIQGLIYVQSVTFFINDQIRLPIKRKSREEYFGSPKIKIDSWPHSYDFEREKDGGRLYLTYTPDKNYLVKIWGKFSLSELTKDDYDLDLSQYYDSFYIDYLQFSLAKRLCAVYSKNIPTSVQGEMAEFESKIKGVSRVDLKVERMSLFGRGYKVTYGDMNYGHGWRPPY